MFNVPDGLSDGEALNYVTKAFPGKMASIGVVYDMEREFDIRSGVPSFQARFGSALTHGNPREVALEFNNIFGKGNWGMTESGSPWVYPEGLLKAGIQPKDDRKVMLDGVGTDMYDFVDIIPETAAVVGVTAADMLSYFHPGARAGKLVARGILGSLRDRALSPGLMARSLRAGAGMGGVSLGLEGVQALRGTNTDSLQKIMTTAGVEGAVMASLSVALGLPFSALGSVTGGLAEGARKTGFATTIRDGKPLEGSQVVKDVWAWRESMRQRGIPEKELDEMMPLPTMKEAFGDQIGGLRQTTASGAIKIEGRAVKEKEGQYVKQSLNFANRMQEFLLGAELAGKSPQVAYKEFWNSLTALERKQLTEASKMINNVGEYIGVSEGEFGISALTELFAENVMRQQSHGMKLFQGAEYYGSEILSNANLNIALSNEQVAIALKNIARDVGLQENQVIPMLQKLAGADPIAKDAVGRLRGSVKIRQEGDQVFLRARKAKEEGDPAIRENLADSIKASQANTVVRNWFQKDGKKLVQDLKKAGVTPSAGLLKGVSDPQAATVAMLREAAQADLALVRSRFPDFTGTARTGEVEILRGAQEARTAAERSAERSSGFVNMAEQKWETLLRNAENFVPKKRPLEAPVPAEHIIPTTAADLRELGKAMRDNLYSRREKNLSDMRDMTISHSELMKSLASTPGIDPGFLKALKDVNSKYHIFKKPFNQYEKVDKKYLAEVTAQNPQHMLESIMAGKKPVTFEDMYRNTENLVGGAGGRLPRTSGESAAEYWAGVGRGEGVRSADELFGTVTNQFVRFQKNKYGLDKLDFTKVPTEEMRRRAKKALADIKAMESVENTASFRQATNKLLDTPLMREYREGLRLIAEGNDKGLAKLNMHLTFPEAKAFVDRMGGFAQGLMGGPGGGSVNTFTTLMNDFTLYKAMARKAGGEEVETQFIKNFGDIMKAEMFAAQQKTGAMHYTLANGQLKNWADNFNQINHLHPGPLKEMLGREYADWVGWGLTLRAAHNVDPTAGAINAAGMPFRIMQKLMHGSVTAAAHPMAFMVAIKEFAPGGVAWRQIMSKTGTWPPKTAGKAPEISSVEAGVKEFGETAGKALEKGREKVNLMLAGRNGLFAASIAAYTGEANYVLPLEADVDLIPVKPDMVVDEAEVAPEMKQMQARRGPAQTVEEAGGAGFKVDQQMANLGKSIVDVIKAVNDTEMKDINIENSLKRGEEIAAGGP